MTVVSNAGPLMALAKLGVIHLLGRLYGSVHLPAAVHDEVVIRGQERQRPDAMAVHLAIARKELVVCEDIALTDEVAQLPLDRGEKQAIQLALRETADWILLDDGMARVHAQARGLKVKGTLGVLVQAHRRGLLSLEEVGIVVDAILARDDIWISEILVRKVWDALRKGG